MTDLALVTNHTDQALGLLISQCRDRPRLSGLVASITNRLQELEDCNWDVINKRLLDYTARDGTAAHAIGAQLDAIGRVVGQPRSGQSDTTYLLYIRAKIFLNKSRARRGQVIGLLQLIETSVFTYTEFYPCTVLIEFTDAPAADPGILGELARRAVTAGVKLYLVAPTTGSSDTFTCGAIGDADDSRLGCSYIGTDGGQLAGVYE